MALSNSISVEFTADEIKTLNESVSVIENLLKSKCKSLTPDERQNYARLGNRTENWSKKTMDYMHSQPGFTPAFVDVPETEKDYNARQSLKPVYNKVAAVSDLMNDTLMLLGSDVYHSCVSYYRNVKLMADQNVNGAKTIYDDLSAQFPGRPGNSTNAAKKA